jgi:hypothetical protein
MTTMMDSMRALTQPSGNLGGMWLLHPEVLQAGREAGYPNGYAYYVTGRGGVLGDVDADVVSSAFGFFEPGLVRKMWQAGVAVEGARAAGARYTEACAGFGRTRLAGFDGAARLAELAGRVASDVDGAGLALFAGWRAEPLPDEAEARAFLLMHVLRELRGSVHILAVVADGLHPRDAVLASGGPAQAKQFGWSEPYPDVAPAAKAAAEALTDTILCGLYAAVLTDAEAAELVTLVTALAEHVREHSAAH